MTTLTIHVTDEDITAAISAPVPTYCPIELAALRLVDAATVGTHIISLGFHEETPAGPSLKFHRISRDLPPAAIAFVRAFDLWCDDADPTQEHPRPTPFEFELLV